MEPQKKMIADIRHELQRKLHLFPDEVADIARSLAYCTCDKTRLTSHVNFIGRCLRRKVIPRGFRIKFNPARINQQYVHATSRVERC